MKWTFENGIPIYLQILARMRSDIAGGVYPAGAKLPPVRELALDAGVNPNTMQRAFAELEREGLVYTQRTSGRFVTEDENVLKELRKTLSREIVNEMCMRLVRLGLSQEEIRAAVADWKAEQETMTAQGE
ncbi:MAG: GntR family transcriptional regulator [Eubacteriales bacterium]|nr:GntR family transcriptional regulator [Eubacteriales bacterium]